MNSFIRHSLLLTLVFALANPTHMMNESVTTQAIGLSSNRQTFADQAVVQPSLTSHDGDTSHTIVLGRREILVAAGRSGIGLLSTLLAFAQQTPDLVNPAAETLIKRLQQKMLTPQAPQYNPYNPQKTSRYRRLIAATPADDLLARSVFAGEIVSTIKTQLQTHPQRMLVLLVGEPSVMFEATPKLETELGMRYIPLVLPESLSGNDPTSRTLLDGTLKGIIAVLKQLRYSSRQPLEDFYRDRLSRNGTHIVLGIETEATGKSAYPTVRTILDPFINEYKPGSVLILQYGAAISYLSSPQQKDTSAEGLPELVNTLKQRNIPTFVGNYGVRKVSEYTGPRTGPLMATMDDLPYPPVPVSVNELVRILTLRTPLVEYVLNWYWETVGQFTNLRNVDLTDQTTLERLVWYPPIGLRSLPPSDARSIGTNLKVTTRTMKALDLLAFVRQRGLANPPQRLKAIFFPPQDLSQRLSSSS